MDGPVCRTTEAPFRKAEELPPHSPPPQARIPSAPFRPSLISFRRYPVLYDGGKTVFFQLFHTPARRGTNRSCHRFPYRPALPGRSTLRYEIVQTKMPTGYEHRPEQGKITDLRTVSARIRTLPRILSALPGGTQIVPATASRTGRLFPAAAPSDMKLSKLKCRPDTNTGPNTGHPEPRKAPKPPDRSAPDTNISPNKNADRIRTSPRAQTPARTRKNQPERYETFRAGACGLMKTFICQFWSL